MICENLIVLSPTNCLLWLRLGQEKIDSSPPGLGNFYSAGLMAGACLLHNLIKCAMMGYD